MEKLSGNCLMNIFGDLSFDAKGSIDGVGLVPLEFLVSQFSSALVFYTLEELVHSLVLAKRESARIGSGEASRTRANEILDRLAATLPSIFECLSSLVHRRCILSHDDLDEINVLVGSARWTTLRRR
ncbi:hypothetical protein GSI_12481 [Ganoderma sinense ZZ0214-1]|uniref:Uncharacterized protein n=1 Tax=Ganoderma sinense ZZ0214-1 TaxID=1077348 RepID=A0A2G8RSV7_9APHY|nr:hypothetical protein GSI_12481 [Ganoderma sinense ZZ0214-1]